MSVQVENLEKNTAKLTIEVPAEKFEEAVQHSYNKNKGKFNIPGFRKGKAPFIGEIEEVEKIRNIYTKEEIYRMKIESHDLEFVVCINSKDLLGEPQPGRRFKGQIWMQGTLKLEDIIRKQGIK